MVRAPGDEPASWVKMIDGQLVPIQTRSEARERKAKFLALHPDCRAWVERIWYWCPPMLDQRAHWWLRRRWNREAMLNYRR